MSKVLQNILYIEDEPDIQRIVKLALEVVAGMSVIACSSGAEAIARAEDMNVDLILLDVMMPHMDGPTTLSRLREIPAMKTTPVIFMTAKAHPHEIAHFKSLGALDVIAKPFDPMKLASTLKEIWAQRMALDVARELSEKNSRDNQRAIAVNDCERNNARQSAEARFAERMTMLTEQFQRELPSRLAALQQQWHALNETQNLEALSELHHNTHNLAGAGATFGYDELTARARAVDRHLKLLLAQQQPLDAVDLTEIRTLFSALETELQRIVVQLEH